MAVKAYRRGYSFSGFEAANPTSPKPGASLDAEFSAVQKFSNDIRAYLGISAPTSVRVFSAETSFPVTLTAADEIIYVTCPLTADRTIQFTALGAAPDAFDIVRTADSTGAFNLVIKDVLGGTLTTIAAHASGRYARVAWSGTAFTVSTAAGTPPDGVWQVAVWQLRVALKNAGLLDDVENHANFAVNPGVRVWEAWNNGSVSTGYGDALSTAIAGAIGATATLAAYTAAVAVSL